MPSRKQYDQTLADLAGMLRRKAMTAREISVALACCRPTVYQRLAALKARGEGLYTLPSEEHRTGPRSLAYGIR